MSTAKERFSSATKLVKVGQGTQSGVEVTATTAKERFASTTRLTKVEKPKQATTPVSTSAVATSPPLARGSSYLTGGAAIPAPSYGAGVQARELKELDIKPREKKTSAAPQKTSGNLVDPVTLLRTQKAAKSPIMQLEQSVKTGKTSSPATLYDRGPTKELERGLELQRLGKLDLSAAQRELDDMKTTQRKKLEDAVKQEIKAQEAIRIYDYPDSQEDYNAAVLAAGERIGAAQAELDALDKAIAEKRSDIQTAKQMRWASVTSQPDFEVYAAKGAALPASVNPTQWAKENHDALKAIETGRALGLRNWTAPSAMYGEMTDEETRIYNYLLAKDQERGTSEAQEYWQYMVNVLKDRRGRAQADEVKNFGLFRPVSTAAYGLAAGFDRGISGIAQNFSDTPLPPSELQYGAGHVRSDLEGVGPEIFGNSLGQTGVDLASTVGNMIPSVAVGTAFGPEAAFATTFLSAGGNAYGEALSQGYSQKEARAYGILSGASEAGLQYVLGGISSLGGKVVNSEVVQASLDNIQHAVLRIPAKYAVAAVGEMTEEYLQEILDPVFRNLALGENNEFRLVTEEAAYAALLAALSVGVMEGPNIVSRDVNSLAAQNGVESTKTASTGEAGEYRATRPQNVEMPTVPIINLSVKDIPGQDSPLLTIGNSLRTSAIERARQRLGLDKNSAAYIPASNVTRDGDEYVLKITKTSLNKMLSPSDGGAIPVESIVVMDNLERIANNGVWFESQGDRKGRQQIVGVDHLKTTVYIDGVPYEVDMRVRLLEQVSGKGIDNVLYYFTPEEIISIKEVGTVPPTGGRQATHRGSEVMPTSVDSIPQTAQDVNPETGQQVEKPGQTGFSIATAEPPAGTLLSEVYDLARRMGACGQKGLSQALEIRKLGGDFNETHFLIGYIDVYLAALKGLPHGPAYLPATVDSHARQLTLVERMQAYHNGVNDAKARVEANQRAVNSAKVAGTEAGLDYSTLDGVNISQETADRINVLAKRLNVRVTFVDSIENGAANGEIVGAEIRIAKDAQNPEMAVLGHEVGHWLEKTAPEEYQALREYVSQRRQEEILYRIGEYEAVGKELDYDGALREFVNDDIGQMIADPETLNKFINENRENRTLLQKVADALRALWKKLTGQERQQVKTAEDALLAALRASEKQAAALEKTGQTMDFATETAETGAEYSLKQFADGSRFVDVDTDQDQFNNLTDKEKLKLATKIIKEKFVGKVIGTDNRVFVNAHGAREYGHPAKAVAGTELDAKARVATELDNLLDAGFNFRTAPDGADGHVHPGTKQFEYFDAIFKVGDNYFQGVINIQDTERGRLFKDVTKIRSVTESIYGSYGKNPLTVSLHNASKNSVPQSGGGVKGDFSLKDQSRVTELERENAAAQGQTTAGRPEQGERVKAYTPQSSISKSPESTSGQTGETFEPGKAVNSVLKRLEKSLGMRDNIGVLRYYAENTELIETRSLPGAIGYDPDADAIRFNPDGLLPDGVDKEGIFLHELSHRADKLLYKATQHSEFVQVIKDASVLISSNPEAIIKMFSDGGAYRDNAFLSDIISALSKGEIEVPFGHDELYWKVPFNVEHEVFANLSAIDAIMGLDSISSVKELEQLLDVFRQIISKGGIEQ